MDEYLDVVDENNKVIGKEKRSIIHNSNMWHRGVHVILRDKEGNFLLQLRSPTKDKFPNRFDCLSEHVNLGEEYLDCAKRGIKEELGVECDLKFLLHFRMIYGPGDYMINKLFECTLSDLNNLKIDYDEISEIKIISEKEIKNILDNDSDKLTPWFKELLKYYFNIPNKLIVMN